MYRVTKTGADYPNCHGDICSPAGAVIDAANCVYGPFESDIHGPPYMTLQESEKLTRQLLADTIREARRLGWRFKKIKGR